MSVARPGDVAPAKRAEYGRLRRADQSAPIFVVMSPSKAEEPYRKPVLRPAKFQVGDGPAGIRQAARPIATTFFERSGHSKVGARCEPGRQRKGPFKK
jgi:hypothetical protein